eukprot:7417667-Pyramimonas_sp.AAC.1
MLCPANAWPNGYEYGWMCRGFGLRSRRSGAPQPPSSSSVNLATGRGTFGAPSRRWSTTSSMQAGTSQSRRCGIRPQMQRATRAGGTSQTPTSKLKSRQLNFSMHSPGHFNGSSGSRQQYLLCGGSMEAGVDNFSLRK